MFSYTYPRGRLTAPPSDGLDPGGVRHVGLFKKLYGGSEEEVQKNLTKVTSWSLLVKTELFVNKNYGASIAMEKVSTQLRALIANRPEFAKYITGELGGSFKWRVVSGTTTLSNHSFAIAFDIVTAESQYWLTDLRQLGKMKYDNKIPYEIVQVFERNKFIWGGKWTNYDTMHFEYRPEIFLTAADCPPKN